MIFRNGVRKMFKELMKSMKWIGLVVAVLMVLVGSWIGLAWVLGWATEQIFNLNIDPNRYISFGSCILVFTFVTQIITVSLTIWFLISWGKAKVNKTIKKAGK